MSTNALASLRSAMIGAGLVVDASFRPGIVWIKTHRAEMVSFIIIAILVIAAASSYHPPHEEGLPAIATPEVIEKAVGDHAPCPGTMHATALQHRLVNGSMEFFYECHAVELTNSSWFAGFVLLVSLVLMVRNYPADLVMLAATLIMFIGGVIPAEKAFYGFSSSTVMSVAAMFIVVKCLEENGSVDAASRIVLGKPKTLTGAVLRMSSIVAFVSAFVLTSPLVTMMIPVVQSWCNRIGLAPVQLMMPLSFSAIIGGCITIIGAPVNLLIISLARDQDPTSIWEMFDPAPVAIPCTIIAIIYMTLTCKFLLPKGTISSGINAKDGVMPRIFYSTFKVVPGAQLVGQTLSFSGLKQARDMTLLTVLRSGNQQAPAEDLILLAGDVLLFCGLPEGIAQMRREKTLEMITFTPRITYQRYKRRLIEASISETSPLIGTRLDDAVFAELYSAVVVGVRPIGHLSGALEYAKETAGMESAASKALAPGEQPSPVAEADTTTLAAPKPRPPVFEESITFDGLFAQEKRLPLSEGLEDSGDVAAKVARETGIDVEAAHHALTPEEHITKALECWHESYKLQPGDAVVIEAHEMLINVHKNSDHFSGMRIVTDSKPPITNEPLDQFRLYFGAIVLLVIIVTSAVNAMPLLQSSCIGAMLLLGCKSITMSEAFYSIKPRVLLTIIASFGIGKSLAASGLATWIAHGMIGVLLPLGEYWVLWGIWLGTSLIGLLVGCYAVSVLMFPICVEAQNMMPHLSLRMFVILVLHGSSTAYGTPLGYVTSIMVQQAANMTWGHFAKFGFILQFALGFVIPALILATIPRTPVEDRDY